MLTKHTKNRYHFSTLALLIALSPILTAASSAYAVLGACTSSKPCTCADVSVMKQFLDDQEKNKQAWQDVYDSFGSTTPPANSAEARTSYGSKAPPLSPVLSSKCPAWGTAIKLGGVDPNGTPVYDTCFCNNFCDSMVNSVGNHEKRHVSGGTAMMIVLTPWMILAQMTGATGTSSSDSIAAQILSLSEIDAHSGQVDELQKAYNELMARDADGDGAADSCKPTPVTALSPAELAAAKEAKSAAASQGLAGRISLLYSRVVHGAD
jgi:hypothetical protein